MQGLGDEHDGLGAGNRADLRDLGLARDFHLAWAGLHDEETAKPELVPLRLARACVEVLGVDGAGISFYDGDFRVPVGASDEIATVAERLQFTFGEGPCLESAATHRMLLADADELENRWPAYAEDLFRQTPFRTVVSVPLPLTEQSFAALDLFLTDARVARRLTFADIQSVAEQCIHALATVLTGSAVGDRRTDGSSTGWDSIEDIMPIWLTTGPAQARTYVWLAMGIVMVKFGVTAADAVALLRSYGYGHEQLLDDVATGVVDGTIPLADMQP